MVDDKKFVLRSLTATFFEGTAAPKGLRVIETTSPKDLATILESHLVREPSSKSVKKRSAVEELLDFYGLLEIASMIGCIPQPLPVQIAEKAKRVLTDPYVRRYYELYYPTLLQSAFLRRIEGAPVDEPKSNHNVDASFQMFLLLLLRLQREDIDMFLWFLDDGTDGGADLMETLNVVIDADRLAKTLTRPARNSRDLSVHGFFGFLETALEFESMLASLSDFPMVQSAMWHHLGYWFRQLDGQVLGVIGVGIDRFLKWSVDTKAVEAMFKTASAREAAIARMDGAGERLSMAHVALMRLTSAMYRQRLEERMLHARPRPKASPPIARRPR